jgi:hypothetical protein
VPGSAFGRAVKSAWLATAAEPAMLWNKAQVFAKNDPISVYRDGAIIIFLADAKIEQGLANRDRGQTAANAVLAGGAGVIFA